MTVPARSFASRLAERFLRALKPAYLVLAAVGVGFGALYLSIMSQEYHRHENAAFTNADNLTRVIAERLEATLRRADNDLRLFIEFLPPDAMEASAARRYRGDFEARLRAKLAQFPEIATRTVVDAHGDAVYRAGGSARTLNFSDREWFRTLRDNPRIDTVISDVMPSRATGRPIFVMSRAIRDSGGRFLGAATAALNLDFFSAMLESLDVGVSGRITVRNTKLDKFVLSYPSDVVTVSTKTRPEEAARLQTGEKSGRQLEISPVDGIERAVAFRVLDDYPFAISVGLAKKDYLYAWRRTVEISGFMGLSLLAFLIWFLVQHIRNETTLAKLADNLRQSKNELQDVIESTSDGILVEDSAGRILTANRRFYALWRVSRTLAERPDRELLVQHMATLLESSGALLAAGAHSENHEIVSYPPLELRDGRRIEPYASELCRDGMPAGRVWSFHDITERKRTERMHLSIIESTADAFVAFDASLRITAWSARAQSVFGYLTAEAVGRTLADTLLPGTEVNDSVVREMLETVCSGNIEDQDRVRRVQARRKDHSEFPAELQISGFRMGDEWQYTCFIRDISSRMAAERQLAQAQKLEAIGQLTGGLAHDFNNILNIVMGSLDLLEVEREDNRELREAALSAAQRGSEITKSLLAVARRTTLAPRDVDVGASIADVAPLLRQVAGKTIDVNIDVCCPGAVVRMDSGTFSNVMLNLVINARDAMPDGGVLSIRALDADNDTSAAGRPRCIAIDIKDTGCGMAPEVVARAFDPFFTTKERGRGTGLGLAMAHSFARQTGGEATITSKPGVGTTVRLLLPACDQSVVAATGAQTPASRGRGEMVLVVDDEPDLATITRHWLTSLGYRVVAESDPRRALERLENQPFDALVSDVVMPGAMDGVLLAERAALCRPGIAIVLVSGNTGVRLDRIQDRFPLLDKPYTKQQLSIVLRTELQRVRRVAAYPQQDAA